MSILIISMVMLWVKDYLLVTFNGQKIFTEDYIKNYDENSDTGYLLVVDVTYPKDLYEKHIYHFYLRNSKLIKVLSYHVI